MSSNDINKAFVSPYDKFFLGTYAKTLRSPSQLAEINKNGRIALLRDNIVAVKEEEIIWSEF